jgi:hypothetical protein
VALVISVQTGWALEWAHTIWERDGPEVQSYERFTQLFRAVFDHPTEGREGGERLLRLCQGSRTASEYSLYFQKVAVSNGWNDQARRFSAAGYRLMSRPSWPVAMRTSCWTSYSPWPSAWRAPACLSSQEFGSLPGTSAILSPWR